MFISMKSKRAERRFKVKKVLESKRWLGSFMDNFSSSITSFYDRKGIKVTHTDKENK